MGSIILFSSLFLGILNYKYSESIAINIIKKNNSLELKNISDYYFDKLISDTEYIVKSWAISPEIKNYKKAPGQSKAVNSIPENFDSIYQKWMGLTLSSKDITWIYYGLEEDGSLLISPVDETMPLDYDSRKREWYKGSLNKKGDVFWTEPYLDAGKSGKMVQTVSKAVYDDKGKLKGVIGLDIELKKFTEIIDNLSYSKNSYIFLLNQKNDVLAHNSYELHYFKKNIIDNITQNESEEIINIDKVKYVVSKVPINVNDWKLVAITKTNLESELTSIKNRIISIFLIAIALSIFMAIRMSKNLLRPLNKLIIATEQVSDGNFKIRTSVKSNDEFSLLSTSFNQMLEQIEILLKQRDDNYLNTIKALANSIEVSDLYTRGHCDRVDEIALVIARKLKLSDHQKNTLKFACILHDVGKIGVPNTILNKPGRLTIEEYELIKKHPLIGYEIIKEIDFLKEPAEIILQHHERIDGHGYPNGLLGAEIRIEAKILSVADTYDSMSSSRIYRKNTLPFSEIEKELVESKGKQLDAEIVDILLELLRENDDSISVAITKE
ncbi:MAG: putative nucleotidyltransferase with HDIG domain [Clostridium sp.]|jgi:putative nucleotidyltransferase with HDIG domain